MGFVEYYDENHDQKGLTVFHKPNEFEYQSEFRFHIMDSDPKPLDFKIGSLKDISKVMDSSQLMTLTVEQKG